MKRNLVTFITVSIFICGLAGFFIWGLTSLLFAVDYPEKNELRYEECTFIGYENVRDRGTRYYIFVNEYDEPLEIDNIVSSSVKSLSNKYENLSLLLLRPIFNNPSPPSLAT